MQAGTQSTRGREFPPSILNQLFGPEQLAAGLYGIAPCRRLLYQGAWNHWHAFAPDRHRSPWLRRHYTDLDDNMVGLSPPESHLMGNEETTIRGDLSAIRFWRVISGLRGVTVGGGRYRRLLRGLKRTQKGKRKIPGAYAMLQEAAKTCYQDPP